MCACVCVSYTGRDTEALQTCWQSKSRALFRALQEKEHRLTPADTRPQRHTHAKRSREHTKGECDPAPPLVADAATRSGEQGERALGDKEPGRDGRKFSQKSPVFSQKSPASVQTSHLVHPSQEFVRTKWCRSARDSRIISQKSIVFSQKSLVSSQKSHLVHSSRDFLRTKWFRSARALMRTPGQSIPANEPYFPAKESCID